MHLNVRERKKSLVKNKTEIGSAQLWQLLRVHRSPGFFSNFIAESFNLQIWSHMFINYSKYTCCVSALIWQLLSHTHTHTHIHIYTHLYTHHGSCHRSDTSYSHTEAHPHLYIYTHTYCTACVERFNLAHTHTFLTLCIPPHTLTHTNIQLKPWWLGLFLSDWKCSVCNSSSVLQKQRENHSLCSFPSVSIYLFSSFTPHISTAFYSTDKDFSFFNFYLAKKK